MKPNDYIPVGGRVLDGSGLKIAKASELAELLTSGVLNWATLVECRVVDSEQETALTPFVGAEFVILDVDVEVPQTKANDIRRVERVAVAFWPSDNTSPETLALRSDFPRVPHLNLRVSSEFVPS